jgi:cytochrome c biogenesis protein CcmG/thiol:disulfide interchange protein DsbE
VSDVEAVEGSGGESGGGWTRGRIIGVAIGVGVAVLVVTLLIVGLVNRRNDGPRFVADEVLAPAQRKPAPVYSLPVLSPGGTIAPAGRQVSLANLRGEPVLVNVWASWCGPCRDETPVLEGIWNRYKARGLTVLGLNVEDVTDNALGFIHKYKLTYPSLRDGSQKTKQQFGYTGVPETFLVDKNGKVALYVPGPLTPADINGFDAVVTPLLRT